MGQKSNVRNNNALILGIVIGAIVLGIAIVAFLVLTSSSTSKDLGGYVPQEQRIPNEGRSHVATGIKVNYKHNPPASGPHWPSPANWGIYKEQVPTEAWVHNLEHGGIVVLYNCRQNCKEVQKQLENLYNSIPPDPVFNEKKILITPYPSLQTSFAALAWDYYLPMDSLDNQLVLRFYREHINKGPELVP